MMTEEQIASAYRWWCQAHDKENLLSNELIEPFLKARLQKFKIGEKGWLKRARQALRLSTERVSTKLKVSRAAYSALENREESGSVSIKNLAAAAEAMDCELVYALIPKSKKKYSEVVWLQLLAKARHHKKPDSPFSVAKVSALMSEAKYLMEDPAFRRSQNWSQRKKPK